MKLKNYIIWIWVSLFVVSCKKDNLVYVNAASVKVINSLVNAGSVKVNLNATNFFTWANASNLNYGAGVSYQGITGSQNIAVVSAADTTKILFKGTLNLIQPVNTLYLSGKLPAVDTMFRTEQNIPLIKAVTAIPDSSVYVRFVNLISNSTPVNIKIQTEPNNEVSSLGYKKISEFKKYIAKPAKGNYTFEVRDATTNILQFSYVLNQNNVRFKTISLVLKGQIGEGGSNAPGIALVSYN